MKEVTLGIDIGGTNTAFGIIDSKGHCISKGTMPTNVSEDPHEYFKLLHNEIEHLIAHTNESFKIKGIGIGAPNGNYYTGTVEFAPNLKWEGVVDVVSIFSHYYNLPIKLTNDANAAAIGELIYGAAKGMKDFIVITLGTGLGSGIVANGKLIYGHDGFAGEIGHTIYDPNGRDCGCGRKGCLETYCSASGIKRTAFELLANRNTDSELRKISYNDLTAKAISDAANNGDFIAQEAFEITGRILGLKLADAVAHTSPEAIFLFGGLAKAGDLIFKPTRKYMEESILPIFKNKIKLLPSGLDDDNAAILGASALACLP